MTRNAPQLPRLESLLSQTLVTYLIAGLLTGCGSGVTAVAPSSPIFHGSIQGTARDGQYPVAGAAVMLYAVTENGDGSPATPLLPTPATTASDGTFAIRENFACPSDSVQIYAAATGGRTPLQASGNPRVAFVSLLGTCDNLKTTLVLNEVTTVATVSVLAPYFNSVSAVGYSPASSTAFQQAITVANELVNPQTGTTPGTGPSAVTIPVAKIDALANILASCVASTGGQAGDGSPCGMLLREASADDAQTAANTAEVAAKIANNPTRDVLSLFSLGTAYLSYQPTLSEPPQDWRLFSLDLPSAPVLSLAAGTYIGPQTVTIADADSAARIVYTTDGSRPTAASPIYSGPITVNSSLTLSAAAIENGNISSVTSASYTMHAAATRLVFLTQPASGFIGSGLGSVQVASEDDAGHLVPSQKGAITVTLDRNPEGATLTGVVTAASEASVATFAGLSVSTPGSGYALRAFSRGLRSVTSAPFNVYAPAMSLAISNSTASVGAVTTGALTLAAPAGPAGLTVTLTSNTPTLLTVSPTIVIVPAGATTATFSCTGIAPGSAQITASAVRFSPATLNVTITAAAVGPNFFGMSILNESVAASSTIPYGTARTWDSLSKLSWSDLNPAMGVYNFASLDAFVARNQAKGRDILYTFGRTPQWASASPQATPSPTDSGYGLGQCAPPANYANWDAFVTAIVTHVAGKIKYWELWNEPETAATYCDGTNYMPLVVMAQHAYKIIKDIDPTAVVLSPSFGSDQDSARILETFLSSGGASSIDVVAFHGYGGPVPEYLPYEVKTYITTPMANAGAAGKPLWDTEASWGDGLSQVLADPAGSPGFVSKYFLLHWSLGAQRFIWYAYDGQSVWGNLYSNVTGETAAATAYRQVYLWMTGATMTSPCTPSVASVWSCTFTRNGGYTAQAVWVQNGSWTFAVPSQYKYYRDLAGNLHSVTTPTLALTDTPILLETADPIAP